MTARRPSDTMHRNNCHALVLNLDGSLGTELAEPEWSELSAPETKCLALPASSDIVYVDIVPGKPGMSLKGGG